MKLILEFEPEELIDLKHILDDEKDMIYKSDKDKVDTYKPIKSNYTKSLEKLDSNTKTLQAKNREVKNSLDDIMQQFLKINQNDLNRKFKDIN